MAWRVVSTDTGVWHVDPAAERRSNTDEWQLVLSVRAAEGVKRPSRWATVPVQSDSKAKVFEEAESLGDDDLRAVIASLMG